MRHMPYGIGPSLAVGFLPKNWVQQKPCHNHGDVPVIHGAEGRIFCLLIYKLLSANKAEVSALNMNAHLSLNAS